MYTLSLAYLAASLIPLTGAVVLPQVEERAVKDFYLRIMPLGASITEGVKSSDGNGYRKPLVENLTKLKWKVNMVGSKKVGTMQDNENEGWPGAVIKGVHEKFSASGPKLKPNVVLINVGTNDCGEKGDGANTKKEMKELLDEIYAKIDGVTVILSTLLQKGSNNVCASKVSEYYRELVKEYTDTHRIGLADINPKITVDMLADGTHPKDPGYKIFADVWTEAITKIEDKIQSPLDSGPGDSVPDTKQW